jgi:hypothetical protein
MVKPEDWFRQIPRPVLKALLVLDEAGYEAWLVGGCVRDLAIGREPLDFDVSTSARPERVLALFPRSFATGLAHGTVTVLVEDHLIEITTFRTESEYSDGRRPDKVAFETDILKDLSRRDFTINSMAYHPRRGLLDPFGGWNDLSAGMLRTVGDAGTRFREDALRLLRALRFTLTYNLTPDPALLAAAATEKQRIYRLSAERITHELSRLMLAAHGPVIRAFAATELLPVLASRLFGLEPDNWLLTELLADWIRPAWHQEQALPLFYLACRLCCGEEGREYARAGNDRDTMSLLRQLLRPQALAHLPAQFQNNCRLSRSRSRHGHAMLYMAGLRLHLPLHQPLKGIDQAVALRVLVKTLALLPADARRCAIDGWAVLALLLPANEAIASELISLRQQYQLEQDPATTGNSLPICLNELALGGHDLQRFLPALRGPEIGLILERLLSYVQTEPQDNSRERLLELAAAFLRP